MPRRTAFRLPRHPASVGPARHRVRGHLAAWGHGPHTPAVCDILLLVREPATDVVRHGPLRRRRGCSRSSSPGLRPGEELRDQPQRTRTRDS
ncbi:hypothetical protein [Streptomyces sp. NPDC086777]|uniref:hypothetical protein n=1 Tax=Streptomyces sp. NPDC086777 TaxID=3154866 RepID=UPI00344FAE5F